MDSLNCAAFRLLSLLRTGTLRPVLVVILLVAALSGFVRDPAASPMFASPFLSFDTGLQPYGIAIADLNEDGYLDIVETNSGPGAKVLTPKTWT